MTTAVSVTLRRPRNETPEHWALKLIAYGWLWRTAGCRVIGFEVPIGPWTVDVVGVAWPKKGKDRRPLVYAAEAKGHRGDWLADLGARRMADEAWAEEERLRGVLEAAGLDPKRPPDRRAPAEVRALHAAYDDAAARKRKHERWVQGVDGWGHEKDVGKLLCPRLRDATSARYVIAVDGVVRDGELSAGWGLISADCPIARALAALGAP